MTPELAAATCEIFLGKGGFEPEAKLDIDGIKKVLELRSEYGKPQKTLTNPDKYIDLSYYEAARKNGLAASGARNQQIRNGPRGAV
jgi:hypothetical protein